MFKKIKIIISVLLLAFAVSICSAGSIMASSQGTGNVTGDKSGELVITVVENIPAADIEENNVPLAQGRHSSNINIMLIIILAAFVLIVAFIAIRGGIRRSRMKRIFAAYEQNSSEKK